MKTEKEKIRCSRCNSIKLFEDIDKRTGEGFVMCLDCGYNHTLKWKQNENGDFVRIDKSKGISLDNVILEKTEIKNPFGVYLIKKLNNHYEFGTINDSEDYDVFRQFIYDLMPYDANTEIIVSRYEKGDIILEELSG